MPPCHYYMHDDLTAKLRVRNPALTPFPYHFTIAAACKEPKADPSSDVKELAQSLCSGATEDKQLAFSTAVAKGGQGAVDAVAALIHAQTQLECLADGEFFDIVPPISPSECMAALTAESCCHPGGM